MRSVAVVIALSLTAACTIQEAPLDTPAKSPPAALPNPAPATPDTLEAGTGNGNGGNGGDGGVGSSDDDAASSATGDDGGTASADGLTASSPLGAVMPAAVSSGGTVLTHPKFVAISFPNDSEAAALEQFMSAVGGSDYWKAISAEYGVGAATAGTPIHLTEKAPTTIDAAGVKAWVAKRAASGAFGVVDAQTVYTVFYPASTSITEPAGDGTTLTSCKDIGGYHDDVVSQGVDIAYAVIPRCASLSGFAGMDGMTFALSHELIEAATDPHFSTAPAFVGENDLQWAIGLGNGGEVGDMCEPLAATLTGSKAVVSRSWSNAAAASGHDPCLPAVGSFIIVRPTSIPDTVDVPFSDGTVGKTRGFKLPKGSSRTLDLVLTAENGSASGAQIDVEQVSLSQKNALTFVVAKGAAAGQFTVQVTRNADDDGGFYIFTIATTLGSTTRTWVGALGD